MHRPATDIANDALRIGGDVAEALDDWYGERPTLHILQVTFGTRVGKALDELIELYRDAGGPVSDDPCDCGERCTEDCDGNAYGHPHARNPYARSHMPVSGDGVGNAAIPGFDFSPVTGEYTESGHDAWQKAVLDEFDRLVAMGVSKDQAASVVRDPRYTAPGGVKLVHMINHKLIGPDNPGRYGRTHDFDCPGCVASGTPFDASPRSETYWSS